MCCRCYYIQHQGAAKLNDTWWHTPCRLVLNNHLLYSIIDHRSPHEIGRTPADSLSAATTTFLLNWPDQWQVYQDSGASLVSQLVQLVQYGPMLASECGYILFRITYRTLSNYIWGLFWARHHCGTLSSAVIPVCTYFFIQQAVYLMQSGKEGKELVCNNFHILSYMSIDLQSLPLQLNFKADSNM